MDTGADLLRAILAAPDDDAPRLIYADWLDESGDADHARFIRDQIKHYDPDRKTWTLMHRPGRLHQLAAYRPWRMGIGRVTTPAAFRIANGGRSWVVFRRGFPDRAGGTLEAFFKDARRLFAVAPVRDFQLCGYGVEYRPEGKVSVSAWQINRIVRAMGLTPPEGLFLDTGKNLSDALVAIGRRKAGL